MSTRLLLASLIATLASLPAHADAPARVYDVPRLDSVTIDGDAGDWGESGFRVDVLVGSGALPKPDDFMPAFRLAWSERGLLVLATVRDDEADEASDIGAAWRKDSIELFLADKRGGAEMMQLIISPGVSERAPDLRMDVREKRTTAALRAIDYEPAVARTRDGDRYVVEVLLPWEGLGVEAADGREVGFQIYMSDADGGGRYRTQWATGQETANNTSAMNTLRLSDAASAPVTSTATASYDRRFGGIDVTAVIVDDGAQRVAVKRGDEVVGEADAAPADGRAVAELRLPIPPRGAGPQSLDVWVNDRLVTTFELPDADVARAKHIAELAPIAKPSVFSGESFPSIDFNEPTWAERLIGRYEIERTFLDANYNEVEKPEKPGRYGAIVSITGEGGETLTRYITLYKTPTPYNPGIQRFTGEVMPPASLGIDDGVAERQEAKILQELGFAFHAHTSQSDSFARLLSGLAETPAKAPPMRSWSDGEALNRQWWLDYKRKQNGNAERYTAKSHRPDDNPGGPAPTLRKGKPEQAGMSKDAAKRIDTVLAEWSNDTDQPFVACVVRDGVVVLHKAYGTLNGEKMTAQTQTWMASITKLVSGVGLMMLVDQGLVSLDDPAEKYLPDLAAAERKPATLPTLRHLVTHTADMWGHWGDGESDFELRVAELYPYLAVGKQHAYNGMSLSLSGKVVEQVTGEALPQYLYNHLTGPLGMVNTDVNDSAAGCRSVAYDMAIFGQMLLNGGAYGDLRFMKEDTVQAMLPRKLDAVLGPETEVVWGVGMMPFHEHGLSEKTFGHGAASGATLRIDPEHKLVITMSRNAEGKNFSTYYPRFIRTVVECIESE